MRRLFLLLSATLGLALPAQALTVLPTHYDMPNGYGTASGGSFNYWDGSYNGSGNPMQDFSWLSGGTGDLTDGVVATENWHLVENLAGTGPYVGWRDLDPVINFHFAAPQRFQSITVHYDDADGFGNVATPDRLVVTLGDRSYTFPLVDAPGTPPNSATLWLTGSPSAPVLTLQAFRRDTAVFISEVQFDALPVPEPHTWALMAGGLLGLGAVARRRRAAPVATPPAR